MALGAAAIAGSGGGGGGGSVTQGTSPWVDNITQIGGSAITLGQALAASSLPVVLTAAQISTLTPPSNTGYSTSARQDTGNTSVASIDTKTPALGQALAAGSVPVVLTAAQLSTLTPLTSVAVTNTGTFAVQSTPVTQADTFMIGGVNIKEINAVTPLMGNGTTGTGSLRVTIASDNTAFAVNSTLSAETTKVIGTVNQGTNPWAANISQINASTAFPIEANTFADSKIGFMAFARAAGSGAGAVVKALIVDSSNNLQVSLQTQTDTTMVGGVNIKEINAVTPLMGAGNTGTGSLRVTLATDQAALAAWGLGATAAAVPAGASYQGGQARSSEAAAATNANLVGFVADLAGKQIVLPYANPENFVSGNATATDTTTTSLIAAPASGLRNYITTLSIWNASASSTYIKIQDGSGGTTIWQGPAPAGGGSTISFPTPLKQPTTATAIFFAANASANAVFISAAGYKGA